MLFFFKAEHVPQGSATPIRVREGHCVGLSVDSCNSIFVITLTVYFLPSQILHYVPYANSAFTASILTHQLKS